MKLVNEKTLKEVHTGDLVKTFRSEYGILKHFTIPHKPGSTGRVCVELNGLQQEWYPSVIGCKFIPK